jgi:hypothetical protein
MRQIPLSKGHIALVDDEDYDVLSRFNWCANERYTGTVYAQTTIRGDSGRKTTLSMHRFLMNPPGKCVVDHIDGDGLNNIRSNLRICEHQDNCANRSHNPHSKSGFFGVYKNDYAGHVGRYMAKIYDGKRLIHLGMFDTPEEAAHARDRAAKKIHGTFARLNFMQDGDSECP